MPIVKEGLKYKERGQDFHGLILAGGLGIRLWPKSRADMPKQFLPVDSGKSLLEMTLERIKCLYPQKNIWIFCKPNQLETVKALLPGFPEENIILEPYPKGTAAAVVYGSLMIEKISPGAVVTVFPSDHVIEQENEFCNCIEKGQSWAGANRALVLYGIKPKSPNTSLGYIEMGKSVESGPSLCCLCVNSFHEKPDLNTAKKYLVSKRFLWNSGIFSFSITYLKELLKGKDFNKWEPIWRIKVLSGEPLVLDKKKKELYQLLPNESFDIEIVERLFALSRAEEFGDETAFSQVVVIPCNLDWHDMGDWEGYYEFFNKDPSKNVILGNVAQIGCSGCLIMSDDEGAIGAIDIRDLAIIKWGDGVLVCPRNKIYKLKELVEKLKNR